MSKNEENLLVSVIGKGILDERMHGQVRHGSLGKKKKKKKRKKRRKKKEKEGKKGENQAFNSLTR